ncbi:hypothetical protein [Halomicrobium salinisoli]|uniref:hypothetical protein n=1 Tax=Halomicrobium salinisoli TaxID=2878391 RepID=UPI001CF03F66|nr:hypothetical protein [Halomicrobium salinisoli]
MGIYVQRGILIVAFAVLLVVSLEHYVGNIVGLLVCCYGLVYGFVEHGSAEDRRSGPNTADATD